MYNNYYHENILNNANDAKSYLDNFQNYFN